MNRITKQVLGALIGLALGTTPVLGQQDAVTYRACFVPQVGAMYLIGLSGLPSDCLSNEHEEISWSDGGGDSGGVGEVADGSISTAKLADGAVSSAKLADGAVGSAKLANGAVGSDHVLDNSLGSIDLAVSSVGKTELASGSVGEDELLANSVGAVEIQAGAVGSSEILDGSITADDIAAGAIGLAIEQVTGSVTIPQGLSLNVAVPCPAGYIAMAGAWDSTGMARAIVRRSEPQNNVTGWSFLVYASGLGGTSTDFEGRVVCIRVTP